MILKVLILVALLLLAVFLIATMKPATFEIERSCTIAAASEKVFPLINDFHHWNNWAPQDAEDRTLVRTFRGPQQGVGAISEWDSSGSAGKGRMEITKSVPPRAVEVTVDFEKPFKAHNVNEFTLVSQTTSTRVTWKMRGTNVFMMKLMGMFMNMDRMMGKHFDTGLQNLKRVAEQ